MLTLNTASQHLDTKMHSPSLTFRSTSLYSSGDKAISTAHQYFPSSVFVSLFMITLKYPLSLSSFRENRPSLPLVFIRVLQGKNIFFLQKYLVCSVYSLSYLHLMIMESPAYPSTVTAPLPPANKQALDWLSNTVASTSLHDIIQ